MQEGWIKLGKLEYRPVHGRYVYNEATRSHDLVPDANDKTHHVEIKLTQDQVTVVDASRLDELKDYKCHAARRKSKYYARLSGSGLMHRFLTDCQWEEVDHKDGNGLMNIDSNLRDGTKINQRNQVRAVGHTYDEHSEGCVARYYGYNGKCVTRRFYTSDYGTRELAEEAAKEWYQRESLAVIARIERDGECKGKPKRPKRTSNSGESNIFEYPSAYHVRFKRKGVAYSKYFSFTTIPKEEALQQAVAWRDEILAQHPPSKTGPKRQKIGVE